MPTQHPPTSATTLNLVLLVYIVTPDAPPIPPALSGCPSSRAASSPRGGGLVFLGSTHNPLGSCVAILDLGVLSL